MMLATSGKRMGRQTTRFNQVGIGDVHAVPADGDRGTAVCGQPVRVTGSTPWPPTFGDSCSECERRTST